MRADDIERRSKEAPTDTTVDVGNEPITVARVNGRIVLEAHPLVADRRGGRRLGRRRDCNRLPNQR
ncbi:MAG: hypothetical protein ACHQ4J_14465 [Candidatus Binatia bacterium]